MAKEDVTEGIGKKREVLGCSDKSISERISESQGAVSDFRRELEGMESVAGGDIPDSLKEDLDRLKADLEEKRAIIDRIMRSVRPLEEDIGRRANLVSALNQRIEDQAGKIELLSKDLLSHKKGVDDLNRVNSSLKEKIVEKEGTISILKEKLAKRNSAFKEIEEKNAALSSAVEVHKKKVFELQNKVGAVESRMDDLDRQNQKLLYDLVNSKERMNSLERELIDKEALVERLSSDSRMLIDDLKKEEEAKRVRIMENHSRKTGVLNAEIAHLKTQLQKQNEAIQAKSRKERELLNLVGSKMKEILSESPKFVIDVDRPAKATKEEVVDSVSVKGPALSGRSRPEGYDPFGPVGTARPASKNDRESSPEDFEYSAPVETVESMASQGSADIVEAAASVFPESSRIDELIPIIELALDHGDESDMIRTSLINSGYTDREVDAAFSKVPIIRRN